MDYSTTQFRYAQESDHCHLPSRRLGSVATFERFSELRAALLRTGGIAKGDDLARLLEDHLLGDYVGLARLIAHHNVFGFHFQSSLWIPMFQFSMRDLSLSRGSAAVVAELVDVLDGWNLAAWFATPNLDLDNMCPAEALTLTPKCVLSVAREVRTAGH